MPTRKPSQKPRIKLTSKYSGEESQSFWDTVNALPRKSHETAYMLGVVIQNLEHDVLNYINNATNAKR